MFATDGNQRLNGCQLLLSGPECPSEPARATSLLLQSVRPDPLISTRFFFFFFLDQENHASGQQNLSDGCEVRPETHGPDADHLLHRRGGEDLRGARRHEPEPVVPAARDFVQAQLQLHHLESLEVRL